VYVNGNMRPAETIPGWGKRRIKEKGGKGEFKYDVFDIRTFMNATMYSHSAQQ
jgi:hypothetical protein